MHTFAIKQLTLQLKYTIFYILFQAISEMKCTIACLHFNLNKILIFTIVVIYNNCVCVSVFHLNVFFLLFVSVLLLSFGVSIEVNKVICNVIVVYFDQDTGAPHSVCWLKLCVNQRLRVALKRW